MADQNEMDEKPLDPKVEEIRRRMMRLMVISIGIMMIGLMSVLGAIIYKFSQADTEDKPPREIATDTNQTIAKDIQLPEGATLVSADLDGNNILLTLKLNDGKRQLAIYNVQNAKFVATYNFGN
jgi:hypothetical protein